MLCSIFVIRVRSGRPLWSEFCRISPKAARFGLSGRWFSSDCFQGIATCTLIGNAMEQAVSINWILYDDTCGFCRRWVPFWGETLRRNGFGIAPLQSSWVADRLHLSEEELIQDLRLLLTDERQILGADVYRYVMRRIWWAYPLYLLSVAPILRNIFNWGYRTFANNRYRVSGKCGLKTNSVKNQRRS